MNRRPACSGRLPALLIVALNTVPLIPIGSTGGSGDSFLWAWVKGFAFVSMPFWSLVLIVWLLARHQSLWRRAAIAELVGGVPQMLFFAWYWPVPLFVAAVRVVDGLLLMWFQRRRSSSDSRKADNG